MPTPQQLTAALTTAAIAGMWQGAVLAIMAAALLRLMPRASASLRHTLLVAIFTIAFVLPWLHFSTPYPQAMSPHTLSLAPWLAAAIGALWLALACVRGTSLLVAWRRLRTVSNHAKPIMLEGIDGFKAGPRHAQLGTSADIDSPTIIGFRSPRLLLPDWMAPLLSADDLQQIALHECEHLRRRDDWLNLLLQLGLVLSPLNPALIWLNRRIGVQRELACDAAVVASTAQPIAYATCLTRLAEQRMHRNRLVLAMAAWGKQSELGQRVHALLSQSAAWTQWQSRLAACATAATLLASTMGLARTPIFVQIATAPQGAMTTAATATVDTVNAGELTLGDAMPRGLRAMPASFTVKPVSASAPLPRAKRKLPLMRKPHINPLPVTNAARDAEQPHMMRTSAYVSQRPQRRNADLTYDSDQPSIRFMTTEFSTPYVAVPVANGWLIFQL